MLKALLSKEFKRYFASSVYVTNTIVGPMMGVGMSISLFFIDFSLIPFDIAPLLPLVVASTLVMLSPNAVSISMEGKQWWQIKSLPIPTKMVVDAKLLFGILLLLPFLLISEICLWLFLKPNLLIILISVLLVIFGNIFALSINTRLCQFDYESEVYVVKQSMSSFIGGIGGPLVGVVLAFIHLLIPQHLIIAYQITTCLLLIIVSSILYNHIINIKLECL